MQDSAEINYSTKMRTEQLYTNESKDIILFSQLQQNFQCDHKLSADYCIRDHDDKRYTATQFQGEHASLYDPHLEAQLNLDEYGFKPFQKVSRLMEDDISVLHSCSNRHLVHSVFKPLAEMRVFLLFSRTNLTHSTAQMKPGEIEMLLLGECVFASASLVASCDFRSHYIRSLQESHPYSTKKRRKRLIFLKLISANSDATIKGFPYSSPGSNGIPGTIADAFKNVFNPCGEARCSLN